MLHQPTSKDFGKMNLSSHIETWGPGERSSGPQSYCQFSLDSSELKNVASPFDDIGYLAGQTSAGKIDTSDRTEAEPADDPADETKPPSSLGNFLQSNESNTDGNPHRVMGRRGRLEKTISKRNQFHEEEASLALSAALKPDLGSKGQGSRNLFEFSKNSLGLSALVPSKAKKGGFDASKESSLGTSKTVSTRSSSRNSSKRTTGSDSKSSFGLSVLGSSKKSEGSRSFGSKFSIRKRSKSDANKLADQDEEVKALRSVNAELTGENNKLQAKLEEISSVVEKQSYIKGWKSIEELANTTTEMHEYKTLCELAELEIEKLHSKLTAYQHLIDAKERSLCNLEKVRNMQEKRIGYLEVKCLQNGVDIDENVISDFEEASLKGERKDDIANNDSLPSFASFSDHGPLDMDEPMKARSSHSLDHSIDLSKAVSEVSKQSVASTASSIPDAKPDSWLAMDLDAPNKKSVEALGVAKKTKGIVRRRDSMVSPQLASLGKFLTTNAPDESDKGDNDLTDTWAPKTLIFDNAQGSKPTEAKIHGDEDMPPPPPMDRANSAPHPTNRKSAGKKTRSKSPGKRRRVKDAISKSAKASNPPEEEDPIPSGSRSSRNKSPSNRQMLRSKSPGTRRRVRESFSAQNLSTMHNSLHNGRRKSRTDLDRRQVGLDRGSAHRRRARNNDSDKKAVSNALNKALDDAVAATSWAGSFQTSELPLPPPRRSSPNMSTIQIKSNKNSVFAHGKVGTGNDAEAGGNQRLSQTPDSALALAVGKLKLQKQQKTSPSA